MRLSFDIVLTYKNFNLIAPGPHQEVHLIGRRRGRRRLAGSEAEDLIPREQLGAADQGSQAAGARQCRFAVRIAQAGEATAHHHGSREGAGNGAQGGEGGSDARPQTLPVRGGSHQGGGATEELGAAWTAATDR